MSESLQRRYWKSFDSNEDLMTEILFGPARIRVARPTVAAWDALETVLNAHGYIVRAGDTHGFYPRDIAETTIRSLHAFGLAIDVNALTNPVRKTPNRRKVWFSSKHTQMERAQDVSTNSADTDMSPEMIADVRAIRTLGKKPVFGWGGDWINKKDAMHFHIDVSPQELAAGIDLSTIHGFTDHSEGEPDDEDDFPNVETGRTPAFDVNDILLEADTMLVENDVERFRPFLDFIAAHEGTAKQPGGGYNTSLGYGIYIPGGEKILIRMTLDQIDVLQGVILSNPANRFNSSALGRYQIVRKTLRGLRKELGLSGNQLYSEQLQDRLAVALIKRRGSDVSGLRNEWASLANVAGSIILAAYNKRGISEVPPIIPDDSGQYADVRKLLEDIFRNIGGTPAVAEVSQVMLKPGDRGPEVKALQEALSRRNYQVGKIDGIYGTLTVAAVAAFQVDYKVAPDVVGSVDTATWAALRDAPGRPLSDERLNTDADDLRKMGSQIVREADRSKLIATITSVLGALGLGNFAVNELSPGAPAQTAPNPVVTAPVDQQIAHAMSPFASTEYRTFFTLDQRQTGAAIVKINDLDRLYERSTGTPAITATRETTAVPENPLIGLISGAANLVLPGAGGSLAMLALGVASHIFGTRIINRRVQDQRNGSNIGAHADGR